MPAARQAETAERPQVDSLDSGGEAALEVRSEVSHQHPVVHVLSRILLFLGGHGGGLAFKSEQQVCVVHLTHEISTN